MTRAVTWARRIRRRMSGVTLVELVSVTAIILVLAGVALPVVQTVVKRQKELELRRALREIRSAIDRFQFDALDVERFPGIRANYLNATNEEGYPEELEWLYEGVDVDGLGTTVKYLRRLPVDPMTGTTEWGKKSSRDRPDSMFSDGINIFNVYSRSEAVALDGTRYAEW